MRSKPMSPFLNLSYDRDLVRALRPNVWLAYLNALQGDTLDSFARDREFCLSYSGRATSLAAISTAAYGSDIEMARQLGKALATFLIEFAVAAPGKSPVRFMLLPLAG